MAQVYRVREINAHRLSAREAETEPTMTAWRVISSRRRYGHWEFMFDDLVVETNLPPYLVVTCDRGAERITLHRLGTVAEVMERELWNPMRGTISLNRERKEPRLEDYIGRNPTAPPLNWRDPRKRGFIPPTNPTAHKEARR